MISVVVPHVSFPEADACLKKCVKSLSEAGAHEIIVADNDWKGYGRAVNQGLSLASGDWLFVCNNDIVVEGFLSSLCSYCEIGVPIVMPTPRDNLPRCFFGLHRDQYNFIREHKSDDFFDTRYGMGYFEDDDLHKRLTELGIHAKVGPVIAHHLNGGGLTIKRVGEQEQFDKNKKIFEEKWKTL